MVISPGGRPGAALPNCIENGCHALSLVIVRTCEVEDCQQPFLAKGCCKTHYRRLRRFGDPLAGPLPHHMRDTPEGRVCRGCNVRKPLTDFAPNAANRLGRTTMCRPCHKLYVKDLVAGHTPERREQSLALAAQSTARSHFGISRDEFAALFPDGVGVCSVCGSTKRTPGRRRLSIDHDHVTGAVRGILCHPCNSALGLCGDDPARLRALADYVEAHSGR